MSSPNALRQLDSTTLADQAYGAIREAIVSGELESREKITERGLAERLAVSATPVREALRRLEQDGLVERTGPRTVQVVDFDDRSVAEIRLAEGALRVVAASLAAKNATAAQLGRMKAMLDAGDREIARLEALDPDGTSLTSADLAGILRITREFHAELNDGCNNPVVLRLLSTVDAFNLAALPRNLSTEVEPRRWPRRGRPVRRPPSHLRSRSRRRRGGGRTTDDRTHPRQSLRAALTYTTPGGHRRPAPNEGESHEEANSARVRCRPAGGGARPDARAASGRSPTPTMRPPAPTRPPRRRRATRPPTRPRRPRPTPPRRRRPPPSRPRPTRRRTRPPTPRRTRPRRSPTRSTSRRRSRRAVTRAS